MPSQPSPQARIVLETLRAAEDPLPVPFLALPALGSRPIPTDPDDEDPSCTRRPSTTK